MPNIGDIESGKKLGYSGSGRYIWVACPICGKERWIQLRYNSPSYVCVKCSQRGLYPVTYTGSGEPKLGDTARAVDVGYKGRGLRVWAQCPDCHNMSWRENRFKNKSCPKCGIPKGGVLRKGKSNSRWSGGKRHADGYIFITIDRSHPYFSMAIKASGRNIYQIAEHRLVMAQLIGRSLSDDEMVHHINGIKSDNRLENLMLLKTNQHHARLVLDDLQDQYRLLETRVTILEAENTRLQLQLESMLIPSQAEGQAPSSVCRDWTGDTLLSKEGKGTVQAFEKSEDDKALHLLSLTALLATSKMVSLPGNPQVNCVANSGNPKTGENSHGNPELNGGSNAS